MGGRSSTGCRDAAWRKGASVRRDAHGVRDKAGHREEPARRTLGGYRRLLECWTGSQGGAVGLLPEPDRNLCGANANDRRQKRQEACGHHFLARKGMVLELLVSELCLFELD